MTSTGAAPAGLDRVIVTGDVHAALAMEVTRDPNNPKAYDPATSRGAVAVEFVTPSISSGDSEVDAASAAHPSLAAGEAATPNPHLKYFNGLNGYLLLDVDRRRVEAQYWLVPFVGRPTDEETLDRSFTVPRGQATLGA